MSRVGPDYSSQGPFQKIGESDKARVHFVEEEVEVEALEVFFASLNNTGGGGGDSKEDKIKQIEKEVQKGMISPTQATSLIFSVLQQSALETYLPSLNEVQKDPRSRLLLHIAFFSLLTIEQVKKGQIDPYLSEKSIALTRELAAKRIDPASAAEQFSSLVSQYNEKTPKNQAYPDSVRKQL